MQFTFGRNLKNVLDACRLSPPLASIHKRINWKARLFSSIHDIGDPVGMTYFSSNYGDKPPAI